MKNTGATESNDATATAAAETSPPFGAPLSFAVKYPAILALLAAIIGISAGATGAVSVWFWVAGAVCALVSAGLALAFRQTRLCGALILLTIATVFGARVHEIFSGSGDSHVRRLVGDGVRRQLFGQVIDWPDVRDNGVRLTVRLDSTQEGSAVMRRTGAVLLRINSGATEFQYGDRLAFSGAIQPVFSRKNPGVFDYERYLRWREIYGVVYLAHPLGVRRDPPGDWGPSVWVEGVRGFVSEAFNSCLGADEAAIARGFLIGDTRDISPEVYQQFRNSGLLHVLAVSGANVALVLAVARFMLWPFPLTRRGRYVVLGMVAVAFSFICHNEPSVVRATLMAIIWLTGRACERRVDLHNIVAVAALLILVFRPGDIHDIGFILSYAITWTLVLYNAALTKIAGTRANSRVFRYLSLPLGLSIAAQCAAAPLTLYLFGVTPLWGLVANILIAPLVSLATIALVALAVIYAILPVAGHFVGSFIHLLLSFILGGLRYFGGADAPLLRQSEFPLWACVLFLFVVAGTAVAVVYQPLRRQLLYGALALPIFFAAIRLRGENVLPTKSSDEICVFATGGGIFARVGADPPTYVVSDLTGDPTAVARFTLWPELGKFAEKDTLVIIALNDDFATLEAVSQVVDSFPHAVVFAPASARHVARDIFSLGADEVSARVTMRWTSHWDARLSDSVTVENGEPSRKLFVGPGAAIVTDGEFSLVLLSDAALEMLATDTAVIPMKILFGAPQLYLATPTLDLKDYQTLSVPPWSRASLFVQGLTPGLAVTALAHLDIRLLSRSGGACFRPESSN